MGPFEQVSSNNSHANYQPPRQDNRLSVSPSHSNPQNFSATIDPSGKIEIVVSKSQQNSLAIGYVRHDGSYSDCQSHSTIRGSTAQGSSKLISINQPGAYFAQVTHNDNSTSTINVTTDPSLASVKIQMGGEIYFVNIKDLKQKRDEVKTNIDDSSKTTAINANSKNQTSVDDTSSNTATNSEDKSASSQSSNANNITNNQNQSQTLNSLLTPGNLNVSNNSSLKPQDNNGFLRSLQTQIAASKNSIEADKPRILKPQNPTPITDIEAKQNIILDEITKYDKICNDIDVSKITDAKSANAALKILDDQRADFLKKYNESITHHQSEFRKTVANSPEAVKIKDLIDAIEETKNNLSLKTKAILEYQSNLDDKTISKPAKVRLVSMSEEISNAYKCSIDRTSNASTKSQLEAEKTKFETDVQGLKKDVSTWTTRIKESLTSLLENNRFTNRLTKFSQWAKGGNINPITAVLDYRLNKLATTALNNNDSLVSKDFSAMEAKEKSCYIKELKKNGELLESKIGKIEKQIAKGVKGLEPDLKTFQEASLKTMLREAECIRARINELGANDKKISGLEKRLNTKLADSIEKSFERVNNDRQLTQAEHNEREAIKKSKADFDTGKTINNLKNKFVGLLNRFNTETQINKQIARAEKLVNADSTPDIKKIELTAEIDLLKTQKSIFEVNKEISDLKNKIELDKDNAALKTDLSNSEDKLNSLKANETIQSDAYRQAKLNTIDARINEIDNELAKTGTDAPDTKAKDSLKAEKELLQNKKFTTEIKTNEAKGILSTKDARINLDVINNKLNTAKTEMLLAKDQATRDAIALKINDLEIEFKRAKMVEVESLKTTQIDTKAIFEKELNAVKSEISKLSDPATPEGEYLKNKQKILETRIEGVEKIEKFLADKTTLLVLEEKALIAKKELVNYKSQLKALIDLEKAGTSLDTSQTTFKTDLEAKIVDCEAAQSRAVSARGTISQRWNRSFQDMRINGARMIAELRNANYSLSNPNSIMNAKINAPSKWMQNNPMKSAIVAAGITEAMHMTTVNYDDDAVHTWVPSISMMLLEKPLETWGIDIDLARFEFTTKEAGVAGTFAAELVNRTGNVAAGFGAFHLLSKTPYAGAALRYCAAPLTHIGTGLFAFNDFSNLDNWQNDSDLALGGRVSSYIAGGAAAGSFFGPPGAIIGAGVGTIGEAAGAAYALNSLDYKLDEQWEQKGVRDSIRSALDGYILPEDDHRVKTRSNLTEVEKEVINDYSRELTLRRIFGLTGEKDKEGNFINKFTNEELSNAGFILLDESTATRDEIDNAGRLNWENLKNLFDNVENNYNPLSTYTYLDQLKVNFPELGKKFEDIKNSSINHYENLYNQSMRFKYSDHRPSWQITEGAKELWYNHWISPAAYFTTRGSHDTGKVTIYDERLIYLKEVMEDFRVKFDQSESRVNTDVEKAQLAEAQWQYLLSEYRFPALKQILSNPESRETFLNILETMSGQEEDRKSLTQYSMWTHINQSKTGLEVLETVMPDEFINRSYEQAQKLVLNDGVTLDQSQIINQ